MAIGDPDFMMEGPMDLGDPMEGAEIELAPPAEPQKVVERDAPEPTAQRRALVDSLQKMVKQAKGHWESAFRQMEKDQRFCAGAQWPSETKASAFNDDMDDRYMANITHRHIQQKVATLYCKNPKALCRRRPKLLNTVWDGNMQTLQKAQQTLAQAQMAQQAQQMMMMAAATGAMMPGQAAPTPGGPPSMPMMPPQMPDPVAMQEAQAVIEDAKQVKLQIDQQTKIAKTLEMLYEYELSEQQQPFKSMMKLVIRRAATSGVGWVKLGFQRVMGKNPDFDSRIADVQQRLSTLERISADLADDEIQPDSAEAEQLRILLEDMKKDEELVVREGLMFSYPKPTAVIPDPRTVQLREFLGADWVAEEYILTPNEIQETYGVDIGAGYTAYNRLDTGTDYERARASWASWASGNTTSADDQISDKDSQSALVWEVYNKRDGLVYTICDGYKDFLREPAQPDVYTDRFWPWYCVAFNESEGQVYPLSDVQLIRPMQLELNRTRQGLREHRFANRPKIVYAEGLLSDDDLDALRNHPVNALISISGLQPQQNVEQVLQPLKGVPLDPNLYQTNMVWEDMLRAVGDQEANLGGTSGKTATETSVAASSRSTAMGSATDDIDETLTSIARAAGQILLLNVSEETVKSIVGPGAMWPTLSKAEVSKELMLEIEAGSSGRPNQQMELMAFEKLAPILMQIPGVNPTALAKEAIKRLDDRIDLEAIISEGQPSITAMNGASSGPNIPGPGGQPPNAQGPQGANNAPKPPPPSPSSAAPKPPPMQGGPGM